MTSKQRAMILRAAKSAETVVIPPGRPRDAVSAYTYNDTSQHPTGNECWFTSGGRLTNRECDTACRLIEMQLKRQR